MGLFDNLFGKGRNTTGGPIQRQWDAISTHPGQFVGNDPKKNTPVDLAGSGIYDELGYTRGLPGEAIGPDVQYGSGVVVGHRNDQLMATGGAQAQAALKSGLQNLQTYRPGGAAALLSGYYQDMAQTYLTTASARRTEAPNLMFRYDERQRARAEKAASKAAAINGIGKVLGTIAAVAAAPATGGASLMALPTMAGGGGTQTYPGGVGATVPGGGGSPSAIVPGMTGAGGPGEPQVVGGSSKGGPSAGPPGGGGGTKQVAPGAIPGQGAGGAGGGVSGFPSPGPAMSSLAARNGMDPAHMSAIMDQMFDRDPNWIAIFHARLNVLMARDSNFVHGAA